MSRLDRNRQTTEEVFRGHPRSEGLRPTSEIIDEALASGKLPKGILSADGIGAMNRPPIDNFMTEQQRTARRVAVCHFVRAREILDLDLSSMLEKTIGDGCFTPEQMEAMAYGLSGRLEIPRCEL